MISNERKVGLIPRLFVQGKWGPKEYALLVTDKRSILVLEKESKAGIGGALGGAAGALIAGAAAKSRSFDYAQADPQSLAIDSKNMTISHESLQGIRMKKRFIGPVYWLEFLYQTDQGKGKKLKGQLIPPGVHLKQRKQEGAAGSRFTMITPRRSRMSIRTLSRRRVFNQSWLELASENIQSSHRAWRNHVHHRSLHRPPSHCGLRRPSRQHQYRSELLLSNHLQHPQGRSDIRNFFGNKGKLHHPLHIQRTAADRLPVRPDYRSHVHDIGKHRQLLRIGPLTRQLLSGLRARSRLHRSGTECSGILGPGRLQPCPPRNRPRNSRDGASPSVHRLSQDAPSLTSTLGDRCGHVRPGWNNVAQQMSTETN